MKFMRIVKVRQIVVIAAILLGSGCLQGSKDSAQTINDRMRRHNHLYLNDLFQLREQTLAQVEHEYGKDDSTPAKLMWHYGGKSSSNEGYIDNVWSFRNFQDEGDSKGCLLMLSYFDVNGNAIIRYETNDVGYMPYVIATLDSDKHFNVVEHNRLKNVAISTTYSNDEDDVAVFTYCPEEVSHDHPCIVIVTSSADYKKVMDGQIHLD